MLGQKFRLTVYKSVRSAKGSCNILKNSQNLFRVLLTALESMACGGSLNSPELCFAYSRIAHEPTNDAIELLHDHADDICREIRVLSESLQRLVTDRDEADFSTWNPIANGSDGVRSEQ